MAKSTWQRPALAVTGIALLYALAGCAAAGTAVVATPRAKPAAPAKAESGFKETAKAEDIQMTLSIDPLKPGGENKVMVTLDKKDVKAVEAQVIMATMGHGRIEEMQQVAPGQWEVTTNVIDMDGRWMFRMEVTDANDAVKTATFHVIVKPQPQP